MTYNVWDNWMRRVDARMHSKQINDLVTAILAADMQPQRAVSTLNSYFWQLNYFFIVSRVETSDPLATLHKT